MSFLRLIYWSSLIGGWSAFIGWLFSELLLHSRVDQPAPIVILFIQFDKSALFAILMAILVAIPIGGGICLTSGFANPQWLNLVKRLLVGCVGGLLGGLIGSLPGMCVFKVLENFAVLTRIGYVLGWTLIGVGIGVGLGVSEGIFDRSWNKMRNGLIGGSVGGFLGGLLFVPISYVIGSPMSSRAFAFVLLGLSIGLFVGLAQVILKEAWLTVEEGFRPGRQMILTQELITMGTSEKAGLIFIAYGAKGVEPLHLRITRQQDGRYLLEDNQSRTGTRLNGLLISGPTPLRDGDAIQFGINVVRFNERVRQGDVSQRPTTPVFTATPKVASTAKQPQPPTSKPVPLPASPVQAPIAKAAPVKPTAPVQPTPKPIPTAAVASTPAAAPKPQEGRCPICDKRVVGIPGKRRCSACFTTF